MNQDTYVGEQLKRIAEALEKMAAAALPPSPDHRFPIGEFVTFDWSSIGAHIVKQDRSGAAVVGWNGYTFVRRMVDSTKTGKAILFSRNDGKDEGGAKYHTLVRFVGNLEIHELPDSIARIANSPSVSPPPPHRTPPAAAPLTPPPTTPTPPVAERVTPPTPPPAAASFPGKGGEDHMAYWTKEAQTSSTKLMFTTAIQKLFPDKTINNVEAVCRIYMPDVTTGGDFSESQLAAANKSGRLADAAIGYLNARASGKEHGVAKFAGLVSAAALDMPFTRVERFTGEN